ncbi:MAG: response regulator [candidate division KSB1 bacterium]|nr:response regulator [candidate division KSB1 bacterium]
MAEKIRKTVLIADDEPGYRTVLEESFSEAGREEDCPYEFDVDVTQSATECIQRVRAKNYDVLVLDVRMEEELSGLQALYDIFRELHHERPVRIIFTGFPDYRQCVEAMRHGAWDYIIKQDVPSGPGGREIKAPRVVVNSAVARLRFLDLREEQKRIISKQWLPEHYAELEEKYGGQLVALWHHPEVKVIARGRDAFELEEALRDWRAVHQAWEQPLILNLISREH